MIAQGFNAVGPALRPSIEVKDGLLSAARPFYYGQFIMGKRRKRCERPLAIFVRRDKRHEVEDERALRVKTSDLLGPESCADTARDSRHNQKSKEES